MSKNKKLLITEIILDQLPSNSTFKSIPADKTIMRWWATGRTSSSLRLTDEGKHAFDQAEIEFFDFPLFTEQELKNIGKLKKTTFEGSKFTIKLKKITCPFYVGMKTNQTKSAYIRIYDSKIAMMISLYGSFNEYLESR
jgi:hypothetical protein